MFYDTLDEWLQERVTALVQMQEGQPTAPEDLLGTKVLDAITRLRVQNLRRQNRELRFLQDEAQAAEDRDLVREYVQSNIRVTSRIRRLERAMNERSLSGRRQREDMTVRVPFAEE